MTEGDERGTPGSEPSREAEQRPAPSTPSSEHDAFDDDEPRSIFAVGWFRALLVAVVLALVAAVGGPWLLERLNPPVMQPTENAAKPAVPETPRGAPTAATTAAGAPTPASPAPTAAPVTATPTAAATTAAPPSATPAAAPVAAQPPAAPTGGTAHVGVAIASPTQAAAPRGDWWVQVGAFESGEMARRVAARLRAQNYEVAESVVPARAARDARTVDQYRVVATGVTPEQLAPKLTARSLTAEPISGGAAVAPVLALRDAVELSRALEREGLTVQVRRVTDQKARPAGGGDVLHRVRVAGLADRDAALAARRELQAKGYDTYVGRGRE